MTTIIATLRTSDYRGDHGADVEYHFDVKPGESVEELVDRVLRKYGKPGHGDELVLSILNAKEPTP